MHYLPFAVCGEGAWGPAAGAGAGRETTAHSSPAQRQPLFERLHDTDRENASRGCK